MRRLYSFLPNAPFFKVKRIGIGNIGRLGTTAVVVIIGKMIRADIQGFETGERLSSMVSMSIDVLSSPIKW